MNWSMYEHLPRFPDGRIDFTEHDEVPAVTCVVRCGEQLLLLKRSDRVISARGKWHVVGGFYDRDLPPEEIALIELEEETGISRDEVVCTKCGEPYLSPGATKQWLIHPVLVELKRIPNIILDWEHTAYEWISREQLAEFDTIPSLVKSITAVWQ